MRFPLAVVTSLAVALAGASARPDEASRPASGAAPIDCPLHGKGGSADGLRPFAQTEKYIEFLERPDRASWQKPDVVVAALQLRGTETVTDVGAGSGYFTFRLAKALPRGKVLATDIEPEMVRHIHHKVLTDGIKNVQVALASPKDPGVSPSADLVFVSDVIHHVDGREAWLKKMFSEMKTGAKLVVLEFKEGKLPEGPPESVKISKAKLTEMIRNAGFSLKQDDPNLLPYQTFLVFEKPAATTKGTASRT
jgi:ubiquinone/menaquinone biosynthesis C-methylase UbiE